MIILSLASSFLLTAATLAQSTAFTYQGHLKSGSIGTSGLHDLRFRMFDAASGGAQLGNLLCLDNVHVSNGAFTVTLDFGQQFAAVSPRFLEIQVRTDIGQPCSDDLGFVLLSPRQAVTAHPQANSASSAHVMSAPDGSPAEAMAVDNNGRVGIGTLTPQMPLHIRRPEPVILLQDTASAASQQGHVTFASSSGAVVGRAGFQDPDHLTSWSMLNSQNAGHICFFPGSGGNVGVGTTSPLAKLDVRGDIVMSSNTSSQFALRGEENLRVLRGTISTTGQVLRGSGFTAQRVSAGNYRISYAQSFTSVPAVTATAYRSPEAFVTSIVSSTLTQTTICTFNGSFSDADFDFIIIGAQ